MGKYRARTGNRSMDSAVEYLYKRIDQITPNIYAAFAIVLIRDYGWDSDAVSELFGKTQILWQDALTDGRDMAQICSDEYDINVIAGKTSD